MYICEATGKVSEVKESCNKVTVESRPKRYISPLVKFGKNKKQKPQKIARGWQLIQEADSFEEAESELRRNDIPYQISEGSEIVKEVTLSAGAIQLFNEGKLRWERHKGRFVKVEVTDGT